MPKYTQKAFTKDLKQLGGMIENFYSSQKGGSSCGTEPAPYSRQQGGKSKKEMRHFKVVSVEGSKKEFGSYDGRTPLQAGSKAFKQICIKMSKNKNSCKYKFTIKETTNGSKKKEYKYSGEYKKLATPRVKMFGKTKVVSTHERKVKSMK